MRKPPLTAVTLLAALGLLGGCGAVDRIENVGRAPELSRIEDPTVRPGYQPVRLPAPAPVITERQPNSLWRSGARAFFRDQRAAKVGDILTVTVEIDDEADLENETIRERTTAEDLDVLGLFGFQRQLRNILPTPDRGAAAPQGLNTPLTDLLNTGSTSSYTGNGEIDRNEVIRLRLAAVITQILPNGNFVIEGRQEVRVNFEVRDLIVRGVVRPEDISNTNEIPHDRIAEARISYGGRGQLTDVQQPRYGTQVLDIISPF